MYKGEKEIVTFLHDKSKEGQLAKVPLEELTTALGLNPDMVRRALESLKANGFVTLHESEKVLLEPTEEFKRYMSLGFPEYSVYIKAQNSSGINDLTPEEKSIGIRWAKTKGFVNIEGGVLKATKQVDDVKGEVKKLQDAFHSIVSSGSCEAVCADEISRRQLATKKTSKTVLVEYTGKSPSELADETAFDLNVEAADAEMGRAHIVSAYSDKVKQIMAELGFEEMEGSVLQSAFWNFDALFQPQDHPAREMADTFYVPIESELPVDTALVERVKKAHQDGNATGKNQLRKRPCYAHIQLRFLRRRLLRLKIKNRTNISPLAAYSGMRQQITSTWPNSTR
jgi:phenylalanyl-tRNA synthetase alpha chain